MTASIFSAFGTTASAAETDPFKIPYNKYNVTITNSSVKELKDIPYWEIEYTITDQASDQAGKSASNLLRLIPWTQEQRPEDFKTMNARTVGSYKKALLDLGIREDQLESFAPSTMGAKIIGIKGYATIGPNKKGYNSIFDFQRQASPVQASAAQTASASAEPAASPTVDAAALASLMNTLGN